MILLHFRLSLYDNYTVSIPDEATGFFNWLNPCSITISFCLTQPLTEISTKNLPGGYPPAFNAHNLIASVSRLSRKCGSLDVSTTYYRDSLIPFLFNYVTDRAHEHKKKMFVSFMCTNFVPKHCFYLINIKWHQCTDARTTCEVLFNSFHINERSTDTTIFVKCLNCISTSKSLQMFSCCFVTEGWIDWPSWFNRPSTAHCRTLWIGDQSLHLDEAFSFFSRIRSHNPTLYKEYALRQSTEQCVQQINKIDTKVSTCALFCC
jgi:hypothetical protein